MSLLLFCFSMIVVVIGGLLYVYSTAFYSPKRRRSTVDSPLVGAQYEAVSEHIYRISHIMEKAQCEPITIKSFDGYGLFGRYYHVRDGAPIEILFHGYRSCAFRDCSGSHALTRKMGFNALVVDQRAHGNSDGNTITFGIKERRDCLSWIAYCSNRFGTQVPIILSGLSMGAATVLMAASLPLPDNVRAILADSPYSAPETIIEKVCTDLHYPVSLCRPFIRLAAKLLGHFDLNECSAKESVSCTKIPILLIHGEDDLLVPYSMSYEIASSCKSDAVVQTFPNAGHGLSYLTDPVRYEIVIYEFLMTIPSVASEITEEFHSYISDIKP